MVACVRGLFSPVVPELPATPSPASPRLAERVLWIVIDGLRHDTALETGWMPQLMGLARRGAAGRAMTTPITMTGVGVRAMATGMSPSLADLARNWSLPPVEHDHLFARLRMRGGRAVAMGNETWFQLFPEALARVTAARPGLIKFARPVNGYDRILAKRALELADDDSWELAVLHLGGVDNASHMWTPWDARFRDKIIEVDTDLGRIAAAMGARTTIVITSDHGTSDRGHHGGIDPDERITPLVLVGPGVRPGVQLDARQVDLPATIAALLGLAVPAPVEGHVLIEALAVDAAQAAALRASEQARHQRYAAAYAAQFSVPPRSESIELAEWLTIVRARWAAPLVWALAMIAAAAWWFGLARGSARLERGLSFVIGVAAIGSLVLPLSIVPALVALVAMGLPLLPWVRELRRTPYVIALAVIGLAIAQTSALLVHTFERVINSELRRTFELRPAWLGVAALAACAPFVWRACRAERVAPWLAFALLLAFAMPGDDAALWGLVAVGVVAAAAVWHRGDGWSVGVALGVTAIGFWIGPQLASHGWLAVACPLAIAGLAWVIDRGWPWLLIGAAASITVAAGRPAVVVFALLLIAGGAAIALRRRSLRTVGWGAAIVLGMLSLPQDIPGLVGLVVVCERVGRLSTLRLRAFPVIVACLALRAAFLLVFEGKLAFGNLEIWLGYVAGNEHVVLGGVLVAVKFLLPFVVVLALVSADLARETRTQAITGCAVFLVLRLAEIVLALCTAQGTFYGPYRDVAQLVIVTALLITLGIASGITRQRSRPDVCV